MSSSKSPRQQSSNYDAICCNSCWWDSLKRRLKEGQIIRWGLGRGRQRSCSSSHALPKLSQVSQSFTQQPHTWFQLHTGTATVDVWKIGLLRREGIFIGWNSLRCLSPAAGDGSSASAGRRGKHHVGKAGRD